MKNVTYAQHIGSQMFCKKWINKVYSQFFIRLDSTDVVESAKSSYVKLFCTYDNRFWNSLLQEANMKSSKIIKQIHWRNVCVLNMILWLQPQEYWTELPSGVKSLRATINQVHELGEKCSLFPTLPIIYHKPQKESEDLYPGLVWWFLHKEQAVGNFC